MLIIDGHLDLAWNALSFDRDITQPLDAIRAREGDTRVHDVGTATVSLPALRTAGVRVVLATIFAGPQSEYMQDGYRTPEEAHEQGVAQLRFYQKLEDSGQVRIIRMRRDLDDAVAGVGATPGIVLLLEGAEPLRTPADLREFYTAGVRIVGPAWHATRYAGGTGEPGPLTELGAELLREMEHLGLALDISHLADEACAQAFALFPGCIVASHSNVRTITPVERNLTDEQLQQIVDHSGVAGMVLYNRFIGNGWSEGDGKACVPLQQLLEHARYIKENFGARHLALGSDLDGGVGREHIPHELDSCADIGKIATALAQDGFTDEEVAGVMGGNWLRVLQRLLY
ncbi:MAG: membrane dipeptidase [bacterium]